MSVLLQIINLISDKYNVENVNEILFHCVKENIVKKLFAISIGYVIIENNAHNTNETITHNRMISKILQTDNDPIKEVYKFLNAKELNFNNEYIRTRVNHYLLSFKDEVFGNRENEYESSSDSRSHPHPHSHISPVIQWGKPTFKERQQGEIVTMRQGKENYQNLMEGLSLSPKEKKLIIQIFNEFRGDSTLKYGYLYYAYIIYLVSGRNFYDVISELIKKNPLIIGLVKNKKVNNTMINKFDTFFNTYNYPELKERHMYNKYIKFNFKNPLGDTIIKPEGRGSFINVYDSLQNEIRNKLDLTLIPGIPLGFPDEEFVRKNTHSGKFNVGSLETYITNMVNNMKFENESIFINFMYKLFRNKIPKKKIKNMIEINFLK